MSIPGFYIGTDGKARKIKAVYQMWGNRQIEFAPIVRCEKCKHWDKPYCMLCKTAIGASYHSRDMAYRKPSDFCSYGEPKDGV